MKKTIIITIMVDDVELEELSVIQESLDHVFQDYDNKRITMQIQDESIVTRK